MGLKSTENRYGTMIVSIHWLTVILVLTLLALGFRAAGTADPLAKAAILRFHIPIAVAVFLLTALRIMWWWLAGRRPKPVAGSPRWQQLTAQLVHYSLYGFILLMVASGIGLLAYNFDGSARERPSLAALAAIAPSHLFSSRDAINAGRDFVRHLRSRNAVTSTAQTQRKQISMAGRFETNQCWRTLAQATPVS